MKVCFASCIDARDDSTQTVWSEVTVHRPQVLLLLGGTI